MNQLAELLNKSPFEKLFDVVLLTASRLHASDIHIEPNQLGVEIRLRVYGEMMLWKRLDKEFEFSFLRDVKQICNLDISKSGYRQDVRVSFKEFGLEARVSLLPSEFGEGIVLRLYDQKKNFSLDSVGVPDEVAGTFRTALKHQSGVILLSGATGSGKSTTCYSLINELDLSVVKSISLEDPVEYTLPGLLQIPVTAKLSFHEGLKGILRHDPDVIFVGEVRDEESANLCFQAASTGHLVISTIHANNCSDVMTRLLGLEISKDQINRTLKLIAHQKLVQELCEKCSIKLAGVERQEVCQKLANKEHLDEGDFRARNQEGCSQCVKGIKGRIPIVEIASVRGIEEQNALEIRETLNDLLRLSMKGRIDFRDAFTN